MRVNALIAALLLLTLASSSSAFDGIREGFVLGGGLGFGPFAEVSNGTKHDNAGFATNFLIGYAWDERNMIVYLRDAVFYVDEIHEGDEEVSAQGFGGIGYYHYFGLPGQSAFVACGIGLQDWVTLYDIHEAPDPGFGFLFGGGYEFTRHLQVHGSLSLGRVRENKTYLNLLQLLITISAVAY